MSDSLLLLTVTLLIVIFQIKNGCAYRKYYVEDECISPNKFQKMFFRLPDSGPDSVGELRSNRFGTYSRTGRNCLIQLVPPKSHGLVVTVLKVDFRNHDGCRDYIKINNGDSSSEKLCGYQLIGQGGKTYSSDDKIEILYHTSQGGMGFSNGFKLIFTVTKLDEDAAICTSPNEFKCGNARCIWAGATCDGINNCGDSSDEISANGLHCSNMTPVAIAAVVLGVITFTAILLVLCLCCCRPQAVEPNKMLLQEVLQRPNTGYNHPPVYSPLPVYTYGALNSTRHGARLPPRTSSLPPLMNLQAAVHNQQIHNPISQTIPSAPPIPSIGEVPCTTQHVTIFYDKPPPYKY